LENRDTSSISYKKFNEAPDDKYPTYSICFKGSEFYWYNDSNVFKEFGITSHQYDKILQGQTGIRYVYDYATGLYIKELLDIRNVSGAAFEQKWYFDLVQFIAKLDFISETNEHSFQYLRENQPTNEYLPFYIGHQTSDTICFTRSSDMHVNTIRISDWIRLDIHTSHANFDYLNHNNEIGIFIHRPGQLIRALDRPVLNLNFFEMSWSRRHEFKISQVTVLKNRPASSHPCNDRLEDDDSELRANIVKLIGCTPIYWKHMDLNSLGLPGCTSPRELKMAHHYIENYKEILSSYDPPCFEMKILTMYNEKYLSGFEDSVLTFQYSDKYYQLVRNVQEFGFESFCSAAGGFAGIFVGYSMLQIPELFNKTISILARLKNLLLRKKDLAQ
jgi:hypothetical protein